jgi:hypothetical protein
MAVNFVGVLDVEGVWHSVNVKQIARVGWGEIPDSEKRDMIYLTDGSEVALEHKSGSSILLSQAVGIQDIDDFLNENNDSEDEEEQDA